MNAAGWRARAGRSAVRRSSSRISCAWSTLGRYIPTPDLQPPQELDPLFGAFARAFLAEHAVEIKPKTREFYENLLEQHLASYFEKQRVSQLS
jgi:Phage integrase, N-terminal SAM-like domain